jgi:hypothetical protein
MIKKVKTSKSPKGYMTYQKGQWPSQRELDKNYNDDMVKCQDEKLKMQMYVRLLRGYYNAFMNMRECFEKMDFNCRWLARFLNWGGYTTKNGKRWNAYILNNELTKLEKGLYDEYKFKNCFDYFKH